MVDIPEHLLLRSAEARAKALGITVEQALAEMKGESSPTVVDDEPEVIEVELSAPPKAEAPAPVETPAAEEVKVETPAPVMSPEENKENVPMPVIEEEPGEQMSDIEIEFRELVNGLLAAGVEPNEMMDDPRWEEINERATAVGFETWPVFLQLATME